jgi:hypothetical protein
MSNPHNMPVTCPRRLIATPSPMDEWESDRWSTVIDEAFEQGFFPAHFVAPRTCSYCGGANPDDVIPLLISGWTLEKTDKPYKLYLYPPEGVARPVPPVKCYLMHWTREQAARAEDAMKARHQLAAARQTQGSASN